MPAFLTAKNLTPFINKELTKTSSQVEFILPSGVRAYGYPAELLPQVCEVYLKARDGGVLSRTQEHIAKQCEILVRGLANIGIVALVDEATGYQEVRARDALEKILEQFIASELTKWAKTFPDEFYKEMFRLRGWPYEPWSVRRPGVVGRYTEDLVYKRLAPGVLDELKRKNPPFMNGRRRHKHFQWLTEDVGHPKLREHLASVITLMKVSSDWKHFMNNMNKALPRYGDTREMF